MNITQLIAQYRAESAAYRAETARLQAAATRMVSEGALFRFDADTSPATAPGCNSPAGD